MVKRRLGGRKGKEQECEGEEGGRYLELEGEACGVVGREAAEEGGAPCYARREGFVYCYPRLPLVFLSPLASFLVF